MDFSKYKFRCSSLKELMTNSRSGKGLSETTKGLLMDIFIEETFNRKKEITNRYLDKGNFAEELSLSLVTRLIDEPLFKNKETFENDFIKGTPDVVIPNVWSTAAVEKDGTMSEPAKVIQEGKVIDIKTCWDIHTFARKSQKTAESDYSWQLFGYMWLTETQKSELVYTLVNAPEFLIADEKVKQMYKRGLAGQEGTEEFDKMETEVEREMLFDDIDEKLRMKCFDLAFDVYNVDKVKERVLEAREYLNNLSL